MADLPRRRAKRGGGYGFPGIPGGIHGSLGGTDGTLGQMGPGPQGPPILPPSCFIDTRPGLAWPGQTPLRKDWIHLKRIVQAHIGIAR